jgi:uncharacterized protein YndB with AHSA1/START domain
MASAETAGAPASELVIAHSFAAPRRLVWQAWTEADRLARWWGPKGFATRVLKLDLRPGGMFHYSMRQPNGDEVWGRFVYREIVPPERIVFVSSFADANGAVARNPWSADWPLEVLNTQTFEERDGRTTVTLRGGPIGASDAELATFAAGLSAMQQGFAGTLEQLAEYLKSA